MNYGVYGGAFDPFHNGHMAVIRGALSCGLIDRLIVVPTGVPVLKNYREVSLFPYRYYMTRSALSEIPNCTVSPIEVKSNQISYTLDTLNMIRQAESLSAHDRLFLVCGSDVLFEFDKWHRPREIMTNATLLVAERPGYRIEETRNKASELERMYGGNVDYFTIEPFDVSSREIRKSRDYSNLPAAAAEFVADHDLYPADRPFDRLSDHTYERIVEFCRIMFLEISEKRLLHSLNTAVLSARYAIRFGTDPDKAAIAGLLHDCAKELSEPEQIEMLGHDYYIEPPVDGMIHGPAGAQYAIERYHVDDKEILNAINYHTTGRYGMTDIEKIVFLADKLEPARKFSDLKEIRRLAETDLNAAMIECLTAIKKCLVHEGMVFHKYAEEALQDLTTKEITNLKEEKMDPKTSSEKIAEILTDKKAVDVEIIPVAQKTIIADYFIVASGTSTTHVKSLAEEVSFVMKDSHGISPDHIEGMSTARWVLLDYKDVVVHVFHPEERSNYSLEKLWNTRPEDNTIILSDSEKPE